MPSLRRQLLAWLIPFYLLSAVAAVLVSYSEYKTSVSSFMDEQMRTLALTYVPQGKVGGGDRPPPVQILDRQHVERDGAMVVQLWANDGLLMRTSWLIPQLKLQAHDGFDTVNAKGGRWRTYTIHSAPLHVQVAQSEDFRQRVILKQALNSAEPIAILLPVSAALLWLAVYLALRPMNALMQSIARQDAGSLAELPLRGVPRELRPLIISMNGLLGRLRESFMAQRRFVQDSAHELRTPVTALKLQLQDLKEHASRGAATELIQLEAGVGRMQRLVERLLQLARQDSGHDEAAATALDIRESLGASIGDFAAMAENRNIDLGLKSCAAGTLCMNAEDLRSIIDNLLDNALRYTPTGGVVDVSAYWADTALFIEVADTGPGIPPPCLERVFDRFYRVAGTNTHGSGLGLSIANSAATRYGLHIELFNRTGGPGLLARVSFPHDKAFRSGVTA
ncbi:MAG TPA: ATP-binding protein [Gammaproteobacteria bacterium]|nr:ATP-binding protein [Gammaproteobacteria bacterium]